MKKKNKIKKYIQKKTYKKKLKNKKKILVHKIKKNIRT